MPGRIGKIFLAVNFSLIEISLIAATDAKAKAIVLDSSLKGFFLPFIDSKIILDPFVDDNISDKWINEGLIWLMHARSVIPNNPKNIKGRHPDGTVGRGVQYPFIKPLPGQYHTEWDGSKLIHWKEVIKKMLKYHFENNSPLECISTEFIPATDYGEGNTYSLFDNAVACANWIREEMNNYI